MPSDCQLTYLDLIDSKFPKVLRLQVKLSKNKTPTAQLWPRSGQRTEVLLLMNNFYQISFCISVVLLTPPFHVGSSKMEKIRVG